MKTEPDVIEFLGPPDEVVGREDRMRKPELAVLDVSHRHNHSRTFTQSGALHEVRRHLL
jgi:hypothetical protein